MATAGQDPVISLLIDGATTETVVPAGSARFKIVHEEPELKDIFVSCRFAGGAEEMVYDSGRFTPRYGASVLVTSKNPNDLCYTTELSVRRVGSYTDQFSMVVKVIKDRAPSGNRQAGIVAVRTISPCGKVLRPDALVVELEDNNDVVRSYNITASYDGVEKIPVFTSETGFYPSFIQESRVYNRYFEDLYPDLTYTDVSGGIASFDASAPSFFDKYDSRVPKQLVIKPTGGWESPPIVFIEAIKFDGRKVYLRVDGNVDTCTPPVDR